MIAIRYTDKTNLEELHYICKFAHETTKEEVICIPQNIDVAFNISLDDLYAFRKFINKCIKKKRESEVKDDAD